MSADAESVTPLDRFEAPWGKTVEVFEVTFPGGMTMLRLRIREGRRFTTLDLDPATARHWAAVMLGWAGASADAEDGGTD